MKRFLTMLLVLLLLGGCAAVPSSVPEEPARSGLEQTAIFFEGRVLYDLDGVLVLTEQIDGEEKGELLTFTLGDLPLTDENGKATDRTIQPGDILSIAYDGSVLAIWPGLLSGPTAVQIIGHEETLAPFYAEQLMDLYEKDSGLNGEIQRISLDLTAVSNLGEMEKAAVGYVLWCKSGIEVFQENIEDLYEQGFVKDGGYYETGVLLSLEDSPVENGSFTMSAMKWRSGLGAVGYEDARANRTANGWTCVPEAWFIS